MLAVNSFFLAMAHHRLGEQSEAQSLYRQLGRLMRRELDWVVMKALEKQRARRYETANGMAKDVECYLRDPAGRG